MNKIFSSKYVKYGLYAIAGLFFGWIFFHSPRTAKEVHNHKTEETKAEIWTCSMHPQIRMDKPGKCPICAMDLIPLTQNSTAEMDPDAILLTKEAAQLANVLTSVVTKNKAVKEVRLYGKVQVDERLVQSQVSFISGRIEKLFVNFTGEGVSKGQMLAMVYSPELITAQQELLEAAKTKKSQPEIYEASKEKLRQWKLSDSQISTIEKSGNVKTNIDINSTTSGIVTSKRVNIGDYINQGSVLYEISDLSRVWVMFDAYESDLPFLNIGDKLDFSMQAIPGVPFSGSIVFINPVMDAVTRVTKVRVEINNKDDKLKPEMFATGIVKANLKAYQNSIIIPKSAVLWTGKRSIVYVKQAGDEPVFKIREIDLGPMLGSSYVVVNGLKDGEEIVTHGAFSVDAAAQLEGKPSMMNPEGGQTSSMSDMDMSEKQLPKIKQDNKSQSEQKNIQHVSFMVSGNCSLCKDRIEKAAKSVKGVISAEWNSKTKKIRIEFSSSSKNTDVIQKAIAKVGHDTEKQKAADDVYIKLPECCLYRK